MIRCVPILASILCLALGLAEASAHEGEKTWFPLDVDVWDPPFSTERKPQRQRYTALHHASRKWNVCVTIPHLNDSYWLAVNYGLIMEARRLDIRMTVYEAGGYEKLALQREQIAKCAAEPADALIIGAISADGLNDLVEKYAAAGKPVIDLLNGIRSPAITARAAIDFREMGRQTGEYVKRLAGSSGTPVKIAWLPGPEGAGWSKAGDEGFRATLAGAPVTIAYAGWGDTTLHRQMKLVADALDEHPDITFIVGTSVSAEAAVQEIRRRSKETQIKVLSSYYSPPVHRGIVRGNIVAAPTDSPVLHARLAVDLALRALEKKLTVRHVAAPVQMMDAATIPKSDLSGTLAPEGFRAILSVGR